MNVEQEFLIEFVSSEKEARADFDKNGPSKPIVPMLKRWLLVRFRWILLWTTSILVLFPVLSWHRLLAIWTVYTAAKWSYWFFYQIRSWTTNQFLRFPNLKEEAFYQSVPLLKSAWASSPAHARLKETLIYQPLEGWCGYATVNTVIRSIDERLPLLKYEASARHISLSEMERLLVGAVTKSPQLGRAIHEIEVFSAEYMTSVDDLRRHCRLAMQPQFRYLMIFHRAPLFFNDYPDGVEQKRGLLQHFAAHWSPLLAYLGPDEDDLVLVGDVNAKYGPWLCPVTRIYDSIRNRSFIDGGEWRGLIRLTVTLAQGANSTSNSDSSSSSSSIDSGSSSSNNNDSNNSSSNNSSNNYKNDPALVTPEDAVDRFLLNKVSYYRHVAQTSKDGYMWHENHGSLSSFGHPGPIPFFKLIANDRERGRCKTEESAERDLLKALERFSFDQTMAHVLVRGKQPDQAALTRACYGQGLIPVSLRSRAPKSVMRLDLRTRTASESAFLQSKTPGDDPFHIRELLPTDSSDLWDQLCRCVCESYQGFSYLGSVDDLTDCFSHFFHRRMNCGPGKPLRVLIAQHQATGELAGSVACFVTPGEQVVGSMYNVTVCPRFGRKGLGGRLTCAALDLLRELKLSFCVLQASPQGQPLYAKLGFQPTINDIAFVKVGYVNWPRLGPLLRLLEKYIQVFDGLSPMPILKLAALATALWFSRL